MVSSSATVMALRGEGGDELLRLPGGEGWKLRPAPLHGGKTGAGKGGQILLRDLHRLRQRLPGHEYPQEAVRLRGDGKPGAVGVVLKLEGDQIEWIVLHPGEPVDNKLVGLPAGEAQLFK